jgi:hypothetical protein
MWMEQRLPWEHIHLLTKGKSAHHQHWTTMAMRLPDRFRATNSSENMSVFAPHFQCVYNNHRPADPHFVKHVTQQRTLWELKDPITSEEFSKVVKKLKNAKAVGLTGVPPEAFKAMSACNLRHIYKHCNNFLLRTAHYKQWHCSQCVPVPKSSNLVNPNKCEAWC